MSRPIQAKAAYRAPASPGGDWGLAGIWVCLGLVGGPAFAQAPLEGPRDHAIPTCYEQLKDYAPTGAQRDLTVIIDQTTMTDARLRHIVQETVARLIRPGIRLSIASFSAYSQGRYLDVLVSGELESPIMGKPRDYVPKRQLHQSDGCLEEQLSYARRLVAKTIDGAFGGSDPKLAQSDILAAFRDLSRRVSEAPVNSRLVVIVSDMLENSSISSFYQAARVRRIDPGEELRKAAAAGIRADFHGARVVVIGAGALSERSADTTSYRDPRAMLALEEFWRRWFVASNAEIIEFGKPTPLVEIKWDDAALAAVAASR
jgi:hypothetical protein